MRKLFFFISLLLLVACEDSLVDPKLEVRFSDDITIVDGVAEVNTNDLVTFNIEGDMDILYFYNGKIGSRYSTIDNRDGGSLKVQFRTRYEYTNFQHTNLSFWISTDFNNQVNEENFNNATWTEIEVPYTDEKYNNNTDTGGCFPNITVKQKKDFYSSWINLFDYLPENATKFHLAFRYKSDLPSQTEGKRGTQWYINWFDIRREYENGKHQYYGLYAPILTVNDHRDDLRYVGFRPLSLQCEGSAKDSLFWQTSAAALKFNASPNPLDVTNNPEGYEYCDNDYAISREFEVNPDPEPDVAVALKMTTGEVPSETSVIYEEPGEYTVTFIAKNYMSGELSELIKELKVRVVDPDAVDSEE